MSFTLRKNFFLMTYNSIISGLFLIFFVIYVTIIVKDAITYIVVVFKNLCESHIEIISETNMILTILFSVVYFLCFILLMSRISLMMPSLTL